MANKEYSDEKLARVVADIEKWCDGSKKMQKGAGLSAAAKKNFRGAAVLFATAMYEHHMLTPEKWSAAALGDVLSRVYPEMPPGQEALFGDTVPVLAVLIKYMEDTGVIKPAKAAALIKKLEASARKLPSPAAKPAEEKGGESPAPERPVKHIAPTAEQWKQLFETAAGIGRLKPWEFLIETNLITLMLPGRDEPVYCSVTGRGGECLAVYVYPGYRAVSSFYRLAGASPGELSLSAGFEQDCIACNFGSRDEVMPEDRAVYKALGLRFRGQNGWVYFRSMRPGYLPWDIDREEAALLIPALQNFLEVAALIAGGDIRADFGAGQTLLRSYSPEAEMWITDAVNMPPIPMERHRLIVDNEILLARLKRVKRSTARLEADISYLPAPVQESSSHRPYLPRIILLMDKKSGLPADMHISDSDDGIAPAFLNMLTNYIEDNGRPASINVRNDRTGMYIEDFCRKTDIRLIDDKGVPSVDRLLMGFIAKMGM